MAANFTRVNDGIIVKINGLDNLKKALLDIPRKLRVRALRNALAAGGRVIRNAARSRAPVLQMNTPSGRSAYRRGIRKPGTLRDAISVRTSRAAKRKGDVGVFVNVLPAKAGQGGARNFRDPYYWRWMEFGFRGKGGVGYLKYGASKLGEALNIFEKSLARTMKRLNDRGAI